MDKVEEFEIQQKDLNLNEDIFTELEFRNNLMDLTFGKIVLQNNNEVIINCSQNFLNRITNLINDLGIKNFRYNCDGLDKNRYRTINGGIIYFKVNGSN